MLEESSFMPEPQFTSAAKLLYGTGAVSVTLSKEMSETLAKAELDHFASRYFFYEPERRVEIWLRLTETVAPYPPLAWRHLHLKAGLNVVLASFDEQGEFATTVIQSYLQSPQNAALSLRSHLLRFAANEDSIRMLEDCLAVLQESATDVAVLVPAGVADVESRYTWLNNSSIDCDALYLSNSSATISEVEREILDRYKLSAEHRSPDNKSPPKSFAELNRFQKSCFILVMFFLIVLLLAEIGRLTWIYMERSRSNHTSVGRNSQFATNATEPGSIRQFSIMI